MAKVTLTIAGRAYDLTVRDGDEDRFHALALLVDEKATQAARGMGGMTEIRQLLFAALLLADELDSRPVPPAAPAFDPATIERLAARAEALADRLEHGPATS